MNEAKNGQSRPLSNGQSRFTAERVARTRPKTYRAIVQLLAEPDAKVEQIANVIMPTPEERAEMRATDAKLDEIAARLRAWKPEPDAPQTSEDAR